MVDVIAQNADAKREAEAILEQLVRENTKIVRGQPRYYGHVPEYSDAVWEVRDAVQQQKFTPTQLWGREGKNWHREFRVLPAASIEAHNYMFCHRIGSFAAKITASGRPLIYITPVGPMGQYPALVDMVESMKDAGLSEGIVPRSVFPFAMDEWSDKDGMRVDRKLFPYMSDFKTDMWQQFYGLFSKGRGIPGENLHFAADHGLEEYEAAIDALLARGAGVLVTGGVGINGHISFSESTAGKRLGKELAEKVLAIRGIPLTAETDIQNRVTSSGSMPVPLYANTTYIGLWEKFLGYSARNPGLVQAWFGLDNGEEPLKWQPFTAQCLLAYYLINNQPDPSFAATYVPQFPGGMIIVRSHIDSIGQPRLAK